MKIIDLLNKIANGETPKKIKYDDIIFTYDEYGGEWGYVNKEKNPYEWFARIIDCDEADNLNATVEIIEEEKEIEKLDITDRRKWEDCTPLTVEIMAKINGIIDEINKIKEK